MTDHGAALAGRHSHVFLGVEHRENERRTWWVIGLCGAMMAAEIGGGALFGSIALVADGLHMSTHAGALLLAALAYRYARRHADDPRFTFGTGKLGDLAGFTSAIVLLMIALLIGYEAIRRFVLPVSIQFNAAIPIAGLGLAVNVASVWLLSGGPHHHHGAGHADRAPGLTVSIAGTTLLLEIHEGGVPPRFRVHFGAGQRPQSVSIETERPGGARQVFELRDAGQFLESREEIPEPHEFLAHVRVGDGSAVHEATLGFEEQHGHGAPHRDNNMRAAIIHVMADAAVSVLVICGLTLALVFGWLWMDPLAGIVGACVIVSWSYGLIRDTGAVLLDMSPNEELADAIRTTIEAEGDQLADLHVWRLGPGHLGAVISVIAHQPRQAEFYHALLRRFQSISHVTVEILNAPSAAQV